jgi:methylated-DNA-[protein]-cysteine S-methyltransferase
LRPINSSIAADCRRILINLFSDPVKTNHAKASIMKFQSALVQTRFESPLGVIFLAATGKGLAGLWFDGQRHLPPELVGLPQRSQWPQDDAHPVLQQAISQLGEYFAGRRTRFDLPLDLSHGTAFQQSVWQALLAIAPGDTASYGEISARIGNAGAVRAVGAAVGRNPVSIVVPCHRVIGGDGSLTGYAGGIHRKTALLQLEGALEETIA